MQGDRGMEVRQGLRVQREIQGGQIHLGGGVALRAGRVMSKRIGMESTGNFDGSCPPLS